MRRSTLRYGKDSRPRTTEIDHRDASLNTKKRQEKGREAVNKIVSEKDQVILNRYTSMIAQRLKASKDAGNERQTLAEYRSMMLAINPFKKPPGFKEAAVASFQPKLELRPGLTASVSVPLGKGPFPIMVHAHGHGLRAGSSPEYSPWIRFMSSYGFVVIFPDYRWQPEATYENQVDDMMFAIDWAKKNAKQINGDPNRLILGGDSAGGGLAVETLVRTLEDPNGPRFVAFETVDGGVNGGVGGKSALDRVKADMAVPHFIMSVGSADTGFAAQACEAAIKLGKLGKNYDLHVYDSMPHDFMKFPELDIMRQAGDVMMKWLQKAAA